MGDAGEAPQLLDSVSVTDALADWLTGDQAPYAALIGPSGAGKTTVARRFASTAAKSGWWPEWAAPGLDRKALQSLLTTQSKEPRVVILDDVDEPLLARIRQMLPAIRCGKILLLLKPSFDAGPGALPGCRNFLLRPFNWARIAEFIAETSPLDQAASIEAFLQANPELLAICRNPAILQLVVSLASALLTRGSSAVNPAMFYEYCSRRWLPADAMRAEVQDLAFRLWAFDRSDPRRSAAHNQSVLNEISAPFLQPAVAAGSDTAGSAGYSFADPSFLHYFLAERLRDTGLDLRIRTPHAAVFRYLAGICSPEILRETVSRVLTSPYVEDASENALFLAAVLDYWPDGRMQLQGIRLAGRDLRNARFAGADLSWADLSTANLRNANLAGANLTGANLRGAALDGADLTGASFPLADLQFASLTGANLAGADLSAARLFGCAIEPVGHLSPVVQNAGEPRSITFSSNGLWLAAGCRDGSVRLFDTALWRCRHVLPAADETPILALAFSPDGTALATASADGVLRVRTAIGGGIELHSCKAHAGNIYAVAYSPCGRMLATSGADRSVRIWDALSGALMRMFEDHKREVFSLAFSPDGEVLASASDCVRLWRVTTGELIRQEPAMGGCAFSVAFSPDGRKLASGSYRTIRVTDAKNGWQSTPALEGHEHHVTGLVFAPDNRTLASQSLDRTVRLWNVETGAGTVILRREPGQELGCFALSPGGNALATAEGSALTIWSSPQGQFLRTLRGWSAGIVSLQFSPGGEFLAAGSADGCIWCWDSSGGKLLRGATGNRGPLSDLRVFLRRFEEGPPEMLPGCDPHPRAVAVSDGGDVIAAATAGKNVQVWRLSDNWRLRTLENWGGVHALAVSPKGDLVAAFAVAEAAAGSLCLWSVETRQILHKVDGLTSSAAAEVLAFSADGSLLACAGGDGPVTLWQTAFGRIVWTSPRHASGGATTALAFSRDGKRLAQAAADGSVCLWDLQSGRCLRWNCSRSSGANQEPGVAIAALAFSPDGRTLASGSRDHSVHLWDTAAGGAIATLLHLEPGEWAVLTPDGGFHASEHSANSFGFVDERSAIFQLKPKLVRGLPFRTIP